MDLDNNIDQQSIDDGKIIDQSPLFTDAGSSSSSASSRCPSRQNSLLVRDGSDKKFTSNSGNPTKSVSFHSATSLPTERKIANANDCLQYMIAGSSLLKIRSSSRQYSRFFTLLDDFSGIRWTPTSKKSNKALLPIGSIREIRSGKGTDIFRGRMMTSTDSCQPNSTGSQLHSYSPDCAFSIIYGDNFDALDLIASTPEESNIWVTGLNALIGAQKSPDAHEDQIHLRDKWLEEVFNISDVTGSGFLTDEELVAVVMKLNGQLTASRVHRKLAELEAQRAIEGLTKDRGKINLHQFIHLYKEIATRPEIYFLMIRNANKDFLTVEDLQLFLEGEQGVVGVTVENCREIVDRHEPFEESRRNGQLHIDGFTEFLLSEDCDLFDPNHRTVCQDMSQPLTHYFISTSHNTYLLEDQLKGPSSAEGYVWALKRGCRCIKVDCWDGVEEPVVYHGNTLTSRVSFREVVAAIKETAFQVSKFPLIVHLENHCSLENQRFIAKYLQTEWKDLLMLNNSSRKSICEMSPAEIGSKIIIKGRKLSPMSDCNSEFIKEGQVSDEDEGTSSGICTGSGTNENHGKRQKDRISSEFRPRKILLCRELSDLIGLNRVRFNGDFHSSTRIKHLDEGESHSVCESTAAKLAHACPEEFVQHNKHVLTRIFPNGSRIDSSNYNPQDFWNCGCQMVALNFQTPGQMLDLHDGRFRQNGGCGLVLKPSVMREPVSFFPGHNKGSIPGLPPQILRLKVISGQQLPRPRGSTAKGDSIDPYVVIQIFGIPADCAEVQTKTVSNEGNCPTFDETFEFQLNLPEVALVRFVILDDEYIGDDFIGQYTIAFNCIRTGYRHMRLLSATGSSLGDNCTLFVHVAITNKRGGGGKFLKPHSDIKAIGVRAIDEIIKCVLTSVDEAATMRSATDTAMIELRDEFGLSETANIKQCLRALVQRMTNGPIADANVTLNIVVDTSGFPELQVKGPLTSPHLNKTIVLFDKVLQELQNVTQNSSTHLDTMRQAYEALLELYEDLESLCVQAGLKGKKLNKALDTCAWNMQILRGQIDLMDSCCKECKQAVTQMLSSTDSQLLMAHPIKHKDRSPVINRERPRLPAGCCIQSPGPLNKSPIFPDLLGPTSPSLLTTSLGVGMPRSPTSPLPSPSSSSLYDHQPRPGILKNKSPRDSQSLTSQSPPPFNSERPLE